MSRNWRQVRVFTQRFEQVWFHDLLWEIVRPWRQAKPDADFYFSRYISSLTGEQSDNSDVGPIPLETILPPAYRQQIPQQPDRHWSIRIRFAEEEPPAAVAAAEPQAGVAGPAAAAVALEPDGAPANPAAPEEPPPGPVETALRQVLALPQIQARFWFPRFLAYDLKNDLGGDRFGSVPADQPELRDEHGEIIATMLHANCELVLRSFSKVGDDFHLEVSEHRQNAIMRTAFQSVGHMVANVWWNRSGGHAGVWALDSERGIGMTI